MGIISEGTSTITHQVSLSDVAILIANDLDVLASRVSVRYIITSDDEYYGPGMPPQRVSRLEVTVK